MADVSEQLNHTLTILSMLEQYHSEGKYWDVQIRVNTEVFKCHRWLLAVHLEYFERIFSSNNFVESNTSKDEPITLTEMDASAFKDLLHFMYTGDVCVKDSNVLPLLIMSDFLRLRSGRVKEQCLVYLKERSKKSIPISEALDLLYFAHLKGEKVFINVLIAHICRHLYHYSKDVRLVEIPFEILNAVLKFSKGYILPLRGSSDVLLKIVHNWINHNRAGRSQYRSNLMEYINFAEVSPNCSRSVIKRLENAVDKIVNLSEDIESLSELKMLVMGIDTNLIYDNDQFDGIIPFKIKKVSEMQVDEPAVCSASLIMSELLWKMNIFINRQENDELHISLYGGGVPNSLSIWYCYAYATVTILSHKKGQDDLVSEARHFLFESDWSLAVSGITTPMKWNDLIDSANGYLNDDGSMNFNLHVYADVPFLKMI